MAAIQKESDDSDFKSYFIWILCDTNFGEDTDHEGKKPKKLRKVDNI